MDDPERNIPVRIAGTVIMMTAAEFEQHRASTESKSHGPNRFSE
jgi:hypothetical protein